MRLFHIYEYSDLPNRMQILVIHIRAHRQNKIAIVL